jgi:hypothetical protein
MKSLWWKVQGEVFGKIKIILQENKPKLTGYIKTLLLQHHMSTLENS